MLTNKRFLTILVMVVILGITGCSKSKTNVSKSPPDSFIPEVFLKQYELNVKSLEEKFDVKVPANWEVQLGVYPEGLYWDLANEFSKDVGLDLASLKGKTVEAQIYRLENGLPGQGGNAGFQYPSNVILLVQEGKTVGAWLSFNTVSIGPSVRRKTLEDLTGLAFEQWVDQQDYFFDAGGNGDLEGLSPTEVVDNFFSAINKGDKARAVACLSPRGLLGALTVNLPSGCLYNNGFGHNNSLVENIVEGNPISYELYEPGVPVNKLKEVGDRKYIGVAVKLKNLKWRDPAVDFSEGECTRFAALTKYKNGWKLDGLGTGP